MAKIPKNSGKPWTQKEISNLEKLASGNTPTRLIAHKIGRSADAVYAKASKMKISLKPVNQSPYNRNKK